MAISKGRIIDRTKVEATWRQLLNEWERLDKADPYPMWKKGSDLIDAFIEKIEPTKFMFSIHIPDSGKLLCEQMMGVATLEGALYEGNQLIFEFLGMGVELLGGFILTKDREASDIQLVQLCQIAGEVYGLDKHGDLFKREIVNNSLYPKDSSEQKKTVWVRQSMERYEPPR